MMGAIETLPYNTTEKLSLRRWYLNRGGYDCNGSYWGTGEKLYQAQDDSGASRYVRAPDVVSASKHFPNATFKRIYR